MPTCRCRVKAENRRCKLTAKKGSLYCHMHQQCQTQFSEKMIGDQKSASKPAKKMSEAQPKRKLVVKRDLEKEASPEKTSPKGASHKKASSKDDSPKEGKPKRKLVVKRTLPKKDSPKETSPKETSPKETSPMKDSPKKLVLKSNPPVTWSQSGTLYYYNPPNPDQWDGRIAAFDMDGTLITPFSAEKSPQLLWPQIPQILQSYLDRGYKVLIITNQYGVAKGQVDIKHLTANLSKLLAQLDPHNRIGVWIATDKDNYRKPMTDIWDLMIKSSGETKEAKSHPETFYCGDAGGRKGDFNITDRYFARNLGIKYYTPEEIFLGQKGYQPYTLKHYGDLDLKNYYSETPITVPPELLSDSQKTLVIMVGSPASGKSTLAAYLASQGKGYQIVNTDTMGTLARVKRRFGELIATRSNIIVDNTNPKSETRAYYLESAKAAGYKVYCYFFDLPKKLSFHLSHLRTQMTHGQRALLPKIAIHVYYKNLEQPDYSEPFDKIIRVDRIRRMGTDPAFDRYYWYYYDLDA